MLTPDQWRATTARICDGLKALVESGEEHIVTLVAQRAELDAIIVSRERHLAELRVRLAEELALQAAGPPEENS